MNAAQLDLKHNYYAFALTLIKHISPDKALCKLGLANPYKKIQADEDADFAGMVAMRESGMKYREIAEEYGLTLGCVQKRLRKGAR